MIVDGVSITHVRIPLVEPFRISSGAVGEKDGILVEVHSGELTGVGESSPMSGTFYSSDTPATCWRDLSEVLIPAVLGVEFPSPLHAAAAVAALPGSRFAVAGLETAFWDLEAQARGLPLHRLLGGADTPVESGLAVGLYDDPADMLRCIERNLQRDEYKRVKIKIEPGRDVELVKAVRATFGEIPLFVDANGAYDLSDLETFRALDDFGLMMFEQPFAGPMLEESAELQRQVRTPVCLDESLETVDHLRRALALGSVGVANIKIQRVGGLGPALAMYELCRESSLPVWVGTMPELGVGQLQALALASLPACSFPTDVEASSRWFCDDIIDPWIEIAGGLFHPAPTPGLGAAVDRRKIDRYSQALKIFRP